jgi:outer membrane protein TolC
VRVTFADAVAQAIEKNPSPAIAAAAILRADALLGEARAVAGLQVSGAVTTTTLNRGVDFDGNVVIPRNSVLAALDVRYPLFAAAQWARREQAEDQRLVAELNAADLRRQTALATADAYLAVIATRRVVEANIRARDTAKSHFDLASELEQQGAGSRLNRLRAQQELSTDEGLVESARLALFRAQEALGVLIVADGPADAADEPTFDVPADATDATLAAFRTDLKLFAGETLAAEHAVRDSSRDYWPSITAIFQPQTTHPTNIFSPASRWQLLVETSVPIWDSGQRKGFRGERQAALNIAKATLDGATTVARSETRVAREGILSAERGLASARAAADQAEQVVTITSVAFRAGAATNIEVIDAERRARDADTAVAVAEDTLRRARFERLTALGRFPD